MERDKLDFANGKIGPLFRAMFFPTLIAMFFNSVLNLCDGMFVGHGVGSDALAAINIVAPLFLLCTGIALMFGVGASVIGGIRLSENNVKAARIILTQAFLSGTLIFSLVVCVCLIWPHHVLAALGSSPALENLAMGYMIYILPGLWFLALSCIGMMLIRLDGSPKYAMAIQVVSAVLNIFLDWLMVFPLGMGIVGAAVATSISIGICGSLVVAYFVRYYNTLCFYRLKRSWKSVRLTLRNTWYMIKVGLATFVAEGAVGIMMITGNYMFMIWLGEDGVAAYSIGCYLFPVMFSVSNAVAQSAQPILSYKYGAGRKGRVKQTLHMALITAGVCGLVISVLMWPGAPALVSIFLPSDLPAYGLALRGIPLLGSCAVFFALNIAFIGYYQSLEQAVISTVYMLLRGAVFLIPSFILLPELLGVDGLWLAIPLAEVMTLFVILTVYFSKKRENS